MNNSLKLKSGVILLAGVLFAFNGIAASNNSNIPIKQANRSFCPSNISVTFKIGSAAVVSGGSGVELQYQAHFILDHLGDDPVKGSSQITCYKERLEAKNSRGGITKSFALASESNGDPYMQNEDGLHVIAPVSYAIQKYGTNSYSCVYGRTGPDQKGKACLIPMVLK